MSIIRGKGIRIALLSAVALTAAPLGLLIGQSRIGEWIELRTYDLRFPLRGNLEPFDDLVLVVAGEESFSRIQEPMILWRDHLARAVRALSRSGAAILGMNFILPDLQGLDSEGEMQLVQSLLEARSLEVPVILSFRVRKGGTEPPSPLLSMAAGPQAFAYANLTTDPDDFVRRQELFAEDESGSRTPSLAWAVAEGYADGNLSLPREERIMEINYRGPGTFREVPFWELLRAADEEDEEFLRRNFADRIVLLGARLEGDLHPTPLYFFPGAQNGAETSRTSGLEIHAHAIATLLDEDFLRRVGTWGSLLPALLLSVGAALFSFRISPAAAAAAASLSGVGYLFVALIWAFESNLVLPVVAPLAALGLTFAGAQSVNYFAEGRDRKRMRALFRRYVSSDVIDDLLGRSEDLVLSGERREVSVLFSDIRGFTTRSEKLAPEDLVALLNRYLEQMVEVVHAHGGMVDKFIGDAVMAVFGAPQRVPDHARRAVACGLKMQQSLARLNRSLSAEGIDIIRIGVGVHTGSAVVGNVGSAERLEYTAIGDAVNTAARLEGLARDNPGGVIVSADTLEELGSEFEIESLGPVRLKGKEAPVEIHRVVSSSLQGSIRFQDS